MTSDAVLTWLLDSDPTLRWQVERDLAGAPEHRWRATRARIATEGDGATLLARQDPDGQWAGGAFFPADMTEQPPQHEQPYTATTWTLTSLREWGTDAASLGDTAEKLRRNCRWEYDDLPYWDGEVDVCINAMTLANGAWLGVDMSALAAWFPAHLQSDGGWDCEWVEGSVHSSFHSTINAVRGLLAYEKLTGDASVRAARRSGEEYLPVPAPALPPVDGRAGRALDRPDRVPVPGAVHSAEGGRPLHRGGGARRHPPDVRAAEAVERLRAARRTTVAGSRGGGSAVRPGSPHDVPPGEPSKWVTFLAQRALDRWDAAW